MFSTCLRADSAQATGPGEEQDLARRALRRLSQLYSINKRCPGRVDRTVECYTAYWLLFGYALTYIKESCIYQSNSLLAPTVAHLACAHLSLHLACCIMLVSPSSSVLPSAGQGFWMSQIVGAVT